MKKLTKKQIIVIAVLASLFAVLLTVALLGKFVWRWFDDRDDQTYVLPVLEDGEAYYYIGNTPVRDVVLMFPQLTRADLCQIRVHNSEGKNYFFFHTLTGDLNYFALGQCDGEDWTWDADDLYYPSILDSYVGAFDYTSLYDDTSTLPAMLAAVGAVMIDERIKPEGGTLTQEFLSRYGLSEADSPAYFELVVYLRDGNGNYLYTPVNQPDALVGYDPADGKYYYLTGDGTRGAEYTDGIGTLTPAADTDNTRRVYVGNQTVDDTGYYLYLEGRDTVYTTQSSYLSDVVGRGLGYYIAPRMVTKAESSYANQLTPCFSLYRGNYSGSNLTQVTDRMTVGFTSDSIWQFDADNSGASRDTTSYGVFTLSDLTKSEAAYFKAAFLGKYVGHRADILVPQENLTEVGKTVTYRIRRICGVLTDGGYVSAAGQTVQAGDKVLIAYADGSLDASGALAVLRGCVDLADADVPQALKDLLIGRTVGVAGEDDYPLEGAGALTFSYTYGADYTDLYHILLKISEISAVTGPDGSALTKVAYGSTVTLTYAFYENGERVGEYTNALQIPAEADFDDDAKWADYGYAGESVYTMRTLFRTLIGKETGSYTDADGNATLTADISYPVEFVSDFTLYSGATLEFVTDYEEYLTFGYTNDREMYYGSSLYQIIGPADKTLYGLDANALLTVLQKFEDLTGDETVEMGLDSETMRKYGLYAYRLYYELPFNCYTLDKDDKTEYHYRNAIGYTLYISERQKDGSRYVGSDMYDIVVRIEDGSLFDFAEWDFSTKWVQNNLLMVSYENLRGMVFDLNFEEEEYKRIFGFDITVDRAYPYPGKSYVNGEEQITYDYLPRLYAALVDGGAHRDGLTYEQLRSIFQYEYSTADYSKTPYEGQQHTAAGKLVRQELENLWRITKLTNGVDLDSLYGYKNSFDEINCDGSYYLRRLLQMLNSTCYWGNSADDLTEEEIASLTGDPKNCTMTLALTLCDENGKLYGYTLRFYNYSAHSLVSITDERDGGRESHYFYLQSREVKRIAQTAIALSEGKPVDLDKY